ncbi:MAG TPA: LytTR family DNA-binding domain-containing protein [Lactobacillaceae bacterium]|jgi:DNA-binding LytR/AlgR family response regulator
MKIQFKHNEALENDIQVTIEAAEQTAAVQELTTYLERYAKPDLLITDTQKVGHVVVQNMIVAITVIDDELDIHLQNGQHILVKDRLYKLLAQLNTDFIQINKSAAINLFALEKIKPTFGTTMIAVMQNHVQLSISRQYLPALKQKLTEGQPYGTTD